jgi:hypothetical protein
MAQKPNGMAALLFCKTQAAAATWLPCTQMLNSACEHLHAKQLSCCLPACLGLLWHNLLQHVLWGIITLAPSSQPKSHAISTFHPLMSITCCPALRQVSAYFESHNGKRLQLRGESGEFTLEVVRHDPDNRGESAQCLSW